MLMPFLYSVYGYSNGALWRFSRLGFNGQKIDALTGMYLLGNGYRAYNPIQMRFHSPDNMSPFGAGGFNAYAYCSGDPVNASDPGGHWTLKRYNSMPTLRPRPQPRRSPVPDLQGQPAGLERISNLPAMDNLLSRLKNTELVSLSQTSKTLAQAVGYRSSNRASTLTGSMELLAAAEGKHQGVLPKDALARAELLYPDYHGGPKELMRTWQSSRLADSYEDLSHASAVIGPGGVLGIRQGPQTQWLSPR